MGDATVNHKVIVGDRDAAFGDVPTYFQPRVSTGLHFKVVNDACRRDGVFLHICCVFSSMLGVFWVYLESLWGGMIISGVFLSLSGVFKSL